MPNKETKKKSDSTNYWPLILLSAGVVVLFCINWWWLTTFDNPEKQGQFGDQFGAVNALFSGLAFAGLIFTIILQKKELALQREELSQTRKELNDQKKQMEKQNITLRIQRFENTFFHMLELQQQIVNDLETKEVINVRVREDNPNSYGQLLKEVPVEQTFRGRSFFYYSFVKSDQYIESAMPGKSIYVKGFRKVLTTSGLSAYDEHMTPSYFDHYFRHFYRILKFVKQNEDWMTYEEQYKYTSMLRGTLSRYELVWLFYNGLTENGLNKLKPLMEHYSMLKSLRPSLLVLSKENNDKTIAAINDSKLLESSGFTGRDYEFYLTDQYNLKKYHLSAFYNKNEMQEGMKLYYRWKIFCEDKGIDIS